MPFTKTFTVGKDINGKNNPYPIVFFFSKTSGDSETLTISEDNNTSPSVVRIEKPSGETAYLHTKVASVGNQLAESFSILGDAPTPNGLTLDHSLSVSDTGIYKVVMKVPFEKSVTFSSDGTITEWGVSAPSGRLTLDNTGLGSGATGYVFMPGEAPEYDYAISGATLTENDGTAIPAGSGSNPNAVDDVWKISITSDSWFIREKDTSFVICNSESAANTIQTGAGVCEDANGLRFWTLDDKNLHAKIGAEIDIINTLTDIRNTPFLDSNNQNNWHLNPKKYGGMRIPYASLYGLTGVFRDIGLTKTQYTAGYVRETHQNTLTVRSEKEFPRASLLSFLHAWDDSANPYYNTEYMKRLARIAFFADFRAIRGFKRNATISENDIFDPKLSLVGLCTDAAIGPAVFFNTEMGNITSTDVDAIMPAMFSMLDYILGLKPSTTRNQDAHNLTTLVAFQKLWNIKYPSDTKFKSMVLKYSRMILDSYLTYQNVISRNTPMEEARGHDGSYTGIQNYFIGSAMNMTRGDSDYDIFKNALDRSYGFWSHYVCGGTAGYGAFGHANDSRTNMGIVEEQYDGAQLISEDVVPMVKRWISINNVYADYAENTSANQSTLQSHVSSLNSLLTNQTVHSIYPYTRSDRACSATAQRLYFAPLQAIEDSTGQPVNFNIPILPCEDFVTTTTLTDHRTITGAEAPIIEVKTPKYYASMSTQEVYDFYFNTTFSKYGTPNTFDTSGGNWSSYYGSRGEEVGGVGIELLYNKNDKEAVITSRNINLFSTHQPLVHVTKDSVETLRYAYANSKTTTVTGNEVTIDYIMCGVSGNTAYSTGSNYSVRRILTFDDNTITVDTTITRGLTSDNVLDENGDYTNNIEIFEYIPIYTSVQSIGSTTASQRELFVTGVTANIDDRVKLSQVPATSTFIEYTNGSRAQQSFARIPMSVPVNSGDTSNLVYTIEFSDGNGGGVPGEIFVSSITVIERDGVPIVTETEPIITLSYTIDGGNDGGGVA